MLLAVLLCTAVPALACITCDRQIQEGIFNSAFGLNVLVMVLPFAVLGGVVTALAKVSALHQATARGAQKNSAPLLSAALILGIGLGGFIDGIVLHQILQWHEMISAKLPPVTYVAKSVNMFWDGIFHAVTLGVTLVGIIRLWKVSTRAGNATDGRLLAAGLLGGWGLFNVVEGLFDHHLLKLHNVRERTPHIDAWNYGFLMFSVLLLITGYLLARSNHNKKTLA